MKDKLTPALNPKQEKDTKLKVSDRAALLKKETLLKLANFFSLGLFLGGFVAFAITGITCSALPKEAVNLTIATPIASAEVLSMVIGSTLFFPTMIKTEKTKNQLKTMKHDSTVEIEHKNYCELN